MYLSDSRFWQYKLYADIRRDSQDLCKFAHNTGMVCRIRCQDHVILYDISVDIATTSRVSRSVVTLCRTIGVCLTVTNGSCYYCLLWFNPSTGSPIFIRRREVGVILTPRILWCILSVLS